jgi:DNA-directed RNA polymerase, alpha subunit, bacterial and chloroplast-type
MLDASDYYAKFEFKPLEPGYAMTIGNALRRILLSSLEGFAIASIRIEGVEHEFATIPGVLEDVTHIILNLKQIRFKAIVEAPQEETITLHVAGRDKFCAGDLNQVLTSYKVQNPELVICNLAEDADFTIEIRINKGRGYVVSEENRRDDDTVDTLPIDGIYTPIRRVKHTTEAFRVDQRTDYEKLVLEIETDGTIHPREALRQAAMILISHFALFTDKEFEVELPEAEPEAIFDNQAMKIRTLLMTDLATTELSVRALNCLKAAGITTIADLLSKDRNELLKIKNFGRKSLVELEDFLAKQDLDFDMDLTPYRLDID